MTRSAVVFTSCLVLALPVVRPFAQAGQPTRRTIYVSATEKTGRPVVDLKTSDFEVREGGKVQEINARTATAPLRVALLVSDRGSGAFQGGALRLCEVLLGHAAVSITGIIVQPEKLTDYVTAADALRRGLEQLGRRSTLNQVGAQLIETIYDVSRDLGREGGRSAIVVMRSGEESSGSVRIDIVQNAIRASGAALYVVSSTREDYQTNRVSEVQTVLNDSSRESGGRRIDVVGTTLKPVMEQIAAELINQYEISYTLPAGTKPSDRISVSAKRRGVTVNAPSRVAS